MSWLWSVASCFSAAARALPMDASFLAALSALLSSECRRAVSIGPASACLFSELRFILDARHQHATSTGTASRALAVQRESTGIRDGCASHPLLGLSA